MRPLVRAFFDEATNTITYLVRDPQGTACAVIDSVLDFDYASGRTDTRSADAVIAVIREERLDLQWVLETHVHADHLSAAPYLQEALGGKIGIGANITVVQDTFGKVFNEGTEFQRDGSQFDALFKDGDSYQIGTMRALTLHTPGHTPACMTHVIGDAAFVGDTLFMPDAGSARADFPGGDAATLYHSIKRVLQLPEARNGLNHVAFTVRDHHEVFGGGLHMSRCGWDTELGPGRHPISSAIFWYFISPAGALVEYYADEDELTEHWQPREFTPGPTVFAEWAVKGGIDGHTRRQVNVEAPSGKFMTDKPKA